MAVVSFDDARANLLRKGFRERQGSKHVFFDLYVEGRDVGINTHFSRGGKTKIVDPNLMKLMTPQLRLDRSKQVLELIDCTMDAQQYLDFLRSNGRLLPPSTL